MPNNKGYMALIQDIIKEELDRHGVLVRKELVKKFKAKRPDMPYSTAYTHVDKLIRDYRRANIVKTIEPGLYVKI